MFRSLLRLILVVAILAAVAAFFMGYKLGGDGIETPVAARQIPGVDTEKARQAGATIGAKVATGAAQAEQMLNEGSLTAKIKAKMALDDTVKALAIDVDTVGTIVTLTGAVHSQAEREKALSLARDTAGVTAVADKLVIR